MIALVLNNALDRQLSILWVFVFCRSVYTRGWINGIKTATDTNAVAGGFMLFIAFLSSVKAAVSLVLLVKVGILVY